LDHLERKVRVAESCEYSAGMLRAQNESLRRESEELHRQRAKLEERIVSLLRNESI
jgi:FtsZ-binding cell division protein ZapB